jgi:hypothetical protein
MSSDRSIAADRTLQCACGAWFDVVEWYLVDVARRLDLVRAIASAEMRTHRCPACGVAHRRLTPLGLLVPSPRKPGSIVAVIGESEDNHAQTPAFFEQEPAWCAIVRLQMRNELVRFVNVPWDWIELICTLDFDAVSQ